MMQTPPFSGACGYFSSSDFFSATSARMKLITFHATKKANPKVKTRIIVIVNLLKNTFSFVVLFVNKLNKKFLPFAFFLTRFEH